MGWPSAYPKDKVFFNVRTPDRCQRRKSAILFFLGGQSVANCKQNETQTV